MKPAAEKINLSNRAAVKRASRRADRQCLDRNDNPESIQRENSIFPAGYFQKNRILNFAAAIGK